jgi:hypothetical protein
MRTALIAIALACAAIPARSQSPDPEEREAYRRGYEEGFARGYRKGLDEGQQRVAPPPPPPAVPPPPVATGPIRVTGAFYGTSSKNCDATRHVASRANGKRSYSFEVSNSICGDPARGDRKSLEVTYRCGRLDKTASANEHRTIYLDCTS